MNTQNNDSKLQEVAIELGDCRLCRGCVEMNPDVFEWDENLDMPYVCRSKVTKEEIQDIINCCPEDCIVLVDC